MRFLWCCWLRAFHLPARRLFVVYVWGLVGDGEGITNPSPMLPSLCRVCAADRELHDL